MPPMWEEFPALERIERVSVKDAWLSEPQGRRAFITAGAVTGRAAERESPLG